VRYEKMKYFVDFKPAAVLRAQNPHVQNVMSHKPLHKMREDCSRIGTFKSIPTKHHLNIRRHQSKHESWIPPQYELKSNLSKLHHASIVEHSTSLAQCIHKYSMWGLFTHFAKQCILVSSPS
jgi:hypothetical protein